jgi:hypothetical protein
VEALKALLSDHENRLDAIAQIHRLSILQHRASLDAASGVSANASMSAMTKGAMPSGNGASASPRPATPPTNSNSMGSMGSM